jgi:hypothetical protein
LSHSTRRREHHGRGERLSATNDVDENAVPIGSMQRA